MEQVSDRTSCRMGRTFAVRRHSTEGTWMRVRPGKRRSSRVVRWGTGVYSGRGRTYGSRGIGKRHSFPGTGRQVWTGGKSSGPASGKVSAKRVDSGYSRSAFSCRPAGWKGCWRGGAGTGYCGIHARYPGAWKDEFRFWNDNRRKFWFTKLFQTEGYSTDLHGERRKSGI